MYFRKNHQRLGGLFFLVKAIHGGFYGVFVDICAEMNQDQRDHVPRQVAPVARGFKGAKGLRAYQAWKNGFRYPLGQLPPPRMQS